MLIPGSSRAVFSGLALFAIATCLGPQAVAKDESGPPRLVLQITIDQLRGDMLSRHADRFGDGGFRYLLEALARVPGVRLQLVGQGDEEAMLRALAARLDMPEGPHLATTIFAHCFT